MSDKLREALEKLEKVWRLRAEEAEYAYRYKWCADELAAALTEAKGQEERDMVEDGFGSVWVKKCFMQNCPGEMEVVRPGKAQCSHEHLHAEAPAVTPSELVKSDPDGTYSYNCPRHGLDSGCKCKDSGYKRALEKAKRKLRASTPDLPVSSQHDTEDGNVGHVTVSSSSGAASGPDCGCDEYPECTHALYWYQGYKAGVASILAQTEEHQKESQRRSSSGAASDDSTKTIANVIGFIKSAIGDCVDKAPHDAIREKLWKIVDLSYEVKRNTDAFAEQIRTAEKERIQKELHAKFGYVEGGGGKCACAYCSGDLEALMNRCAEYEMDNYHLKEFVIKEAVTAEKERCAKLVENMPLGYRTQDEHEALENFANRLEAAIRQEEREK